MSQQPRRDLMVMSVSAVVLFIASLIWLGSAVSTMGATMDPPDQTCAQLPNAPGEQHLIQAEVSWLPPGLHCRAYYGGTAGWRAFSEPSWMDTVPASALCLLAAAWTMVATVRAAQRARPELGHRRASVALCLLLLAHIISASSIPVTVSLVGGVVLFWLPLIAVAIAGSYFAAGVALRPIRLRTKNTTVEAE